MRVLRVLAVAVLVDPCDELLGRWRWAFEVEDEGVDLHWLCPWGTPEHLRSDNGPEFVARSERRWLDQAGVRTFFIPPRGVPQPAIVLSRTRTIDYLLQRITLIRKNGCTAKSSMRRTI